MIVPCPACAQSNRLPAARVHQRARCAACKEPLLPASKPVAIRSSTDFDELVRDSPLPVLVDFWAIWCGPCRTVGPELERLAQQRIGSVVVAKVDTDALPDLAERFRIRSIPTMVLFREGKEAKRLSGAMPASNIAAGLSI
jgi:thioredoxin 2